MARHHDGQAPAVAMRQNLSERSGEGLGIESFAALDFEGLQTVIIAAENERKTNGNSKKAAMKLLQLEAFVELSATGASSCEPNQD